MQPLTILAESSRRHGRARAEFRLTQAGVPEVAFGFDLGENPEPGGQALAEAGLLAGLALAMHRRVPLRPPAAVGRSLRLHAEMYQAACTWWWPKRFGRVPIEADLVDDRPPATARGIAAFSGGVDSCHTAMTLKAAGQIDSLMLVSGFDIDADHASGLADQRRKVEALATLAGLPLVTIATAMRKALGETVLEGTQPTVVAAALTLLSDRWGRGYISSGNSSMDMDCYADPNHLELVPMLGSVRFPVAIFGSQIARIEKVQQLLAHWPGAVEDIRVCIDRAGTGDNCGRCGKCTMYACLLRVLTGQWPRWAGPGGLDMAQIADVSASTPRILNFIDMVHWGVNNRPDEPILPVLAARIGETPERLRERTAYQDRITTLYRRIDYLKGFPGTAARRRVRRVWRALTGRDIGR